VCMSVTTLSSVKMTEPIRILFWGFRFRKELKLAFFIVVFSSFQAELGFLLRVLQKCSYVVCLVSLILSI